MRQAKFWAAIVAVAVLCGASQVRADDDSWCGIGPWAYGYSGSLYGLGFVPVPPYFALHPPVYYGERVYRSYGASPFAWRHETPELKKEEAKMVYNPYFQPDTEKQPVKAAQKVAGSQLIENPFVGTSVAGK